MQTSATPTPTPPATLTVFGQPLELRAETPLPDGQLSFALIHQDGSAHPRAVAYDPISTIIKMDLTILQVCVDASAAAVEGPVPAIGRACSSIARGILAAANSVFGLTAIGYVGMTGLVLYLTLRCFGMFAWVFIAMWAQPFVVVAVLTKLFSPDRRGQELQNLQQAIHQHLSSRGGQ